MASGFMKAAPHNPLITRFPEKLCPDFVTFFLKYTKYSCEKLPSSEPRFSQDSLSPNDAVLL